MTRKKENGEEGTEAAAPEKEVWSVKRALHYGDEGSDVEELQEALIASGYGCGKERGRFGLNTKAAVRAFQAAAGIPINGIAGRQTVTALGGEYRA